MNATLAQSIEYQIDSRHRLDHESVTIKKRRESIPLHRFYEEVHNID